MGNKCLGVNKKEMDRLLSIFDNEEIVSVVYEYLDGDSSGIKNMEDLGRVYQQSLNDIEIASSQQEEVEGLLLSAFTYDEQKEIVNNILYLAAWDEDSKSVREYDDIQFIDIEKVIRDIRLTQIWTGTNEIMRLLIQHEYYHEVLAGTEEVRNIELDATSQSDNAEKCYTDEDMWKVHEG